LICEDHNLF
jgi:hypothetical protein